ncbi:hypothetical protein LEN26_018710 [Aphanomyces euteiches]|nr:hypothetical protein LEN26_018710 [Aphanomyces euteiches]KAH9107335.1 hypothetical protein AeMF1_017276 [Aphanomyces euteiches]KAH9197426.1 hypothetical protein AeNC1_000585 [Aphanomyces euteiches]
MSTTRYGSIALEETKPKPWLQRVRGLVMVVMTSLAILALDLCVPVVPEEASVQQLSTADRKFDVIIVGSGPGGLVAAEMLSRDPNIDVLILEAGGPSLQSTGGTLVPEYANETGLTYFDIPGEYANVAFLLPNNISRTWHMEWLASPKNHLAKIVGGSSSINAALYFRSPDAYADAIDWPFSPKDVAEGFEEIEKMFGWTDVPSPDGLFYSQGVYRTMASALNFANFSEHNINRDRNDKDKVYGHPPFTIKHGLRDSPAKTFLGAMKGRPNVVLETYATALQIFHTKGVAAGVVYNQLSALSLALLKPHGAVLLAAGTLNTPKLLFQSGIGPTDQRDIAVKLPLPLALSSASWITNEHVGKHLFDTHQVALTFRASNSSSWLPFGFDYIHPPQEALDQFIHQGQTGPLSSSNPVFIAYETLTHPTTGRPHNFQITVFPHALPHINVSDSPFDMTLCFNLNNPASRDSMGYRNATYYGVLQDSLYWDDLNDLDMMLRFIRLAIARMAAVGTVPVFAPPTSYQPATWENDPKQWIREHTLATDHYGGTCVSSKRSSGCADASFRVVGTKNIFVGDGSLVAAGSVNPYGFVMYTGYQASANVKEYMTQQFASD